MDISTTFFTYLYPMKEDLLTEIELITSRASGPGGQHVNKTESKVELHWNLEESKALSEASKELLRKRLASRLTKDGILILVAQKYRSQLKNREEVQDRFMELLTRLSKPPKKRIATRPSRASKEKRLKDKKVHSEKKSRRKGDFDS